ncbi:glycosyltransferase family 2 protein [Candidatus Lucifugimonas marina]|uniref:glycosyltransferase family 2 protein n=1 Tax=Candidatus Lucifugimonas marina TaxID=3038979 RepID=UPI00319E9E53
MDEDRTSYRADSNKSFVTVAIPVLNEEHHIEQCLASLFDSNYPVEQLEVLVVDGGSTDRTRDLVKGMARKWRQIRLLDNPGRIQATAMNIAISEAGGEILIRLDAHSRYRPQHIERIVETLSNGLAENVGGVQLPVGNGFFAAAAASCLRTSFSMGGSTHRVSTEPEYAESVFLGGWKTETLRDLEGFNPLWKINEDYEMNVRIRESGGRVMVVPELKCEYSVRPNPWALAKQYFRYGFWRMRTIRHHRSAARPRHFVPATLILAMIGAAAGISNGISAGWVIPLIYCMALAIASVNVARSERNFSALLAPAVFALIHLSFGVGTIAGTLRWAADSIPDTGTNTSG